MNVLWFYVIAFVVLWTLALLFRNKLKIEIHGPLLMRRTQRMRDFIDRIGQKYRRIWRWMLNLGIPVAFFFMFTTLVLLILSLETIFEAPQASIIIPGVDIPGSPLFVPLGYGILALATVIIVHEFGHGILARVEGVSIKSIGVLLLAILPGAFVEPDEDEIKKTKRTSRLRIYAAGSVFNLTLALVALLLVTGISSYAIPSNFQEEGVLITGVVPGSPAEGVLQEGMVVKSINGFSTTNFTNYQETLEKLEIGQEAEFVTNEGIYQLTLDENPNIEDQAYIGIRSTQNLEVREEVSSTFGESLPWIWWYLRDIFFWIYALNFLVGIFNLLPAKPLDGGLMLEELLGYKLSDKLVKPIMSSLSIFLFLIIAISIIYGTGRGLLMMF